MTANTVVINSMNKSALLQTIEITDVADVTFPGADNPGEYVYGLITFYSPEQEPETGDLIVISASGKNELMKAAVYEDNYDHVGAAAGSIVALTNSTGGSGTDTLAAATNTSALTDSSGGSANTTIAAITQAANAGSADVGPVADGFADIAAQLAIQRTLNTVLINSITSLGDKVNELVAAT